MSNVMNIQQQIKQNAEELSNYLTDLKKWTTEKNTTSSATNSNKTREAVQKRTLPPVRNSEDQQATQQQQIPATKKASIEELPDDDDTRALSFKNQGNTHFRNKDFKKAIECYNKSLMLKEDPILYCNRSAAQFQLKNFAASELDSSKATTLDHSYAKAYARRAFARRELHNYEGSVQDFQRAVQLDPNNKEAAKELEKVKKLLEEKRKKEKEAQPKRRVVIEEVDEDNVDEEEEIEEMVTPSASRLESSQKAAPSMTSKATSKSTPTTTTTIPKTEPQPTKTSPSTTSAGSQPSEKSTNAPATTAATTTTSRQESTPAASVIPKIRVKIPSQPPTNSYEFEKCFNELFREDFYEYLKIIPPSSFSKLFKESLTEKMLNVIVEALSSSFLQSDELSQRALDVLGHLSQVSRFDMIVMFLSNEEKKEVDHLFDELQRKLPQKAQQIKQVRSKFD